ncbi:hypothetical protein NL676_032527 [Syzygium grande]|nr:hypothetical protein NL676_032527 [Syzygium grande]
MEAKCFSCFFTVLLLCRLACAARASCDFLAMFNFGDSNLSAVFGQAPWPEGETYFHSPTRRYTDGRVLVDFIAESLGLPYLSAYLNSSGFSPISLDVQYNEFYEFSNRTPVARQKGEVFEKLLPKAEVFSEALYTFDIGQNDLTAGYFMNMSTSEVRAYIPDVLGQFKNIVSYIYSQGGRFFWIHNTGPVGCLPYVMERVPILASQVDPAGCASPFNEVAQDFNRGLKEVVMQLRQELPQAAITYVDVYSVKYSLISHPEKYGFKHRLRTCCGHGGRYSYDIHMGCGATAMVNGEEVMVEKSCENPALHVNWDGVHFTEAANRQIFEHIRSCLFSDPPVPLSSACLRLPPS